MLFTATINIIIIIYCMSEHLMEFHEVGCSVQILRKDLQKHLQGSIDYHSKVARETVISLRKEVEEQQHVVYPCTFLDIQG